MQIISRDAPITKLGTKHEDAAGRQDEARVNLCSSQRNTLLKVYLPSYLPPLHHYKSTPVQQKSLFAHTKSVVIKQMAGSMSSPYTEHEDALTDVC